MLPPRILLVLAAVIGLALSSRAGAADLRTIPTRPGVTESLLLLRPAGTPVASVILLAGGDGVVALTPAGPSRLQGNFLLRTRQRFAAEGLLVAVLDSPSDRTSLWNFRTTADHATDLRAAIAAVREIAPVPVWLVGTSMGTLSAASAAARLEQGRPDGIVLTSSVSLVSRMSGESIRHVALGRHPGPDADRPPPARRLPVLALRVGRGRAEGAHPGAREGAAVVRRRQPAHLGSLRGQGGPRLSRARGAGRIRHRGLDPCPLTAPAHGLPGARAQAGGGWARRVRRMRAWMSRTRSCSKSICTSRCSTSQWLTVANQPNRRPRFGTMVWPR